MSLRDVADVIRVAGGDDDAIPACERGARQLPAESGGATSDEPDERVSSVASYVFGWCVQVVCLGMSLCPVERKAGPAIGIAARLFMSGRNPMMRGDVRTRSRHASEPGDTRIALPGVRPAPK